MSSSEVFLSVIIPCYNEQENLERGVLPEVYSFLKTLTFPWEMIISDDGSSDNSRELVQQFATGTTGVSLLKNHHGGKPAAVYEGIKAAQGRYILFTDMDQSTPISELDKFLPYMGEFQVIIGSRSERKNFSWYRKLGSKVFKMFRQALLLRHIQDTQCGFKAFRRDLAQTIFPKLSFFQQKAVVTGWKVTSFDVELLHLAELKQQTIKEILVEWEDRDLAQGKNRSYIKESLGMLKEILRVKLNDLRGIYRDIQ